ncbi:ABC transporter permease [uncultured Cetobacterium sp.]|uniref:ABC transporter permease n=2 Tax=uncultured Cetobacterium sp. TaxID=527638 RepID=UPI0026377165|nr:ABC transporter permease [uncultured Cetobacterium sp.]
MFFIKKFISSLLTIFMVSVISFTILQVIPGDPALSKLGVNASSEQISEFRKSLNLDRPVYIKYGEWAKNVVVGNMGESIRFSSPVNQLIGKRAKVTFLLAGYVMLISIIVGVPLGVASSIIKNKFIQRVIFIASGIGISIPSFWCGLLLMLMVSHTIGGSLITGTLLLPIITLAIPRISMLIIYIKNMVEEEMKMDYVKASIIRGKSKVSIVVGDVLRNIALPLVTIISGFFIKVLVGSVVIESLFNISGLGNLLILAVENRDYPIVQGLILYSSIIVVFINFTTDLIYTYIDPRVKIK